MEEPTNNNQCEDPQMEKEVEEEKFANQQAAHLNRLSVEYFEKYACTQFQPLREFLSHQHCAQVVPSKPDFQPTISKSLRDNLKVERQIQYLKGSLRQQHIYSTIQQELSCDIKYEPIGRRGNLLLDYKDRLYWCYKTKLYSLDLNETVKYQNSQVEKRSSTEQKIQNRASFQVMKQQPKELLDLQEHIYQVKGSRDFLIMRAARKLFIYDLNTQQMIDCLTFKNEILAFWLENVRFQQLYLSLIDGHKTELQRINLIKKSVQIFPNQTQIHTAWSIHSNWAVACTYDSVQSLDFRIKVSQQLRKAQEACRIFGASSLSSKAFSENYFITSESFHTKIFDLRKAGKVLARFNHFCEQAPPTILSIYDSKEDIIKGEKNENRLLFAESEQNSKSNKVLVVATSPYTFGSSLLSEISAEMTYEKRFEKVKHVNSNELLFDKGKLEKGYHPLSSILLHFQSQQGIFHLDNWGGISFQLFHREITLDKQNKEKKQRLRRCQFNKQSGFEQMKAPNQDWLINNRFGMFLKQEKQNSWYTSINDDSMDLELIEDTFKTKYLRYSDLKKFYSQLSLQQHGNLTNILDEEQKELSIFKASRERQNENVLNTLQSTFDETGQVKVHRPLFSEKLLQQLSNQWQQNYSKF